jgi:hypothetical protein
MSSAAGTFEVTLTPQETNGDPRLGRFSLDKQFHGDLEGASKGEMLTGDPPAKGSAGYVAMELVNGKLHGRSGSFILQHTGSMDRGKPSLSVTVVPDSGTEELTGLAGTMTIVVADGKHSYRFEYSLDALSHPK